MKKAAKRQRIPAGKALLQLPIDQDLRRRFKARCAEVETTMADKVEELIRAWLDKK